ncbi:MAG: hypothetical protein JWP01_2588 [Myxococcales bacterium]|nr:hypothetical protein [Myxococcales bacterium]
MRKLACLLVAATMVLVGCDDDDNIDGGIGGGIGDINALVEEANDQDGNFVEFTANITGIGAYSSLSGVGRVLLDQPGVFDSTIEMRSDTPGAVRPWHVHFGTCASGGDIVGPPESYRPLTIGADGTAAVSAQVVSAFDLAADYHINVHVSPADLTVIACGDLFLASGQL